MTSKGWFSFSKTMAIVKRVTWPSLWASQAGHFRQQKMERKPLKVRLFATVCAVRWKPESPHSSKPKKCFRWKSPQSVFFSCFCFQHKPSLAPGGFRLWHALLPELGAGLLAGRPRALAAGWNSDVFCWYETAMLVIKHGKSTMVKRGKDGHIQSTIHVGGLHWVFGAKKSKHYIDLVLELTLSFIQQCWL